MDALRMHQVTLDYPGRSGALKEVTLRVPTGSVTVLRGASGSGKSSLLHIAAGLQAPTGGDVVVLGQSMPRDADGAARMRGRQIGLVFQHLNLLAELTAAQNIAMPLQLHGTPRKQRRQRVDELLTRFGLQELADRLPHRMSGGEQQRVAIARALALGPGLLLVDEPTSSLDEDNAGEVLRALQAAAEAGAGVLVATHDERFDVAGSQYRLVAGRLTPARP